MPPARRPAEFDASAMLPQVMGEIVGLMKGVGGMLTLRASNGGPPRVMFADERLSSRAQEAMLETLARNVRPFFDDGRCFWRDVGEHGEMLLMPIDQISGHGRLVISVLFNDLDPATRASAERLYRDRRPLAVGFFNLWQQNGMLRQRAQSLEFVLDQMTIGVITLDLGGKIVFANRTAVELLSIGDGLSISNGSLRTAHLSDGVNLQAALSHVIGGQATGSPRGLGRAPLLAFRRRNAPPFVATLLPAVSPVVEQKDTAAIMYLVDPRIDTDKMLTPLCELYGLSRVETTLVCHLAAGGSISAAAESMRIKEQTARGYLKTIFIKTETKRQSELIVLMLSSLIGMRRDILQEALPTREGQFALACHAV